MPAPRGAQKHRPGQDRSHVGCIRGAGTERWGCPAGPQPLPELGQDDPKPAPRVRFVGKEQGGALHVVSIGQEK